MAEAATPADHPAAPAEAGAPAVPAMSWRVLLALVVPAIVVGVGSALLLMTAELAGKWIEDILWTTLPDGLGVDPSGPAWIFIVLMAAGVAIGLIVTVVPGHAGPDPATVELAAPPLPVGVLPGLVIVTILMLASGVSLGPENPMIAVNTGLAVGLGFRLIPRVPVTVWSGLAFAGTLGALFGTPVAAALVLSELPGNPRMALWDRIFAPLVAAGAGAITMSLLGGESFAITVAPYPTTHAIDLVTGSVIAVGSALLGLAAVYAFPLAYAAFKRTGSTLVALIIGGALLGVIGAIGGPITLFKGLSQMKELSETVANYTAAGLLAMVLIKLIAVVIASTSGFRGGRIFPSVFIAVALGLFINTAIPQIPQALAIAASLIGILLAVTRSGWIALFMAALLVGDTNIFPLLCIIVLPAWLVVTGKRQMVVEPAKPAETAAAGA